MTTLQFLGATRSVTGSCFLLQHGPSRILIDCGLVQGSHEATARNRLPFPFDPSTLDAVVLSPAHLDHTGLTPRLMAEGFHGRIVTTGITKDLLPVLWDDYVRIQLSDAQASRRGTPLGRRLVDGLPPVKMMGKLMPVKAKIHTINGLSAHADQAGLLEWVGGFHDPKPQTFLVHGEWQKMTVLAAALQARYGIKAMMPEWRETVML